MEEYKYEGTGDYRFNRKPEDRCASCKHLLEISDRDYTYQCTASTGSKAALFAQKKPGGGKCEDYCDKTPETAEHKSRASGTAGGAKGFFLQFLVISIIAFVGSEVLARIVMEQQFNMLALLLRIPFAFAGYLVGWVFRWILINVMGGRTSDWRDKLFAMVLPLLVAVLAALFAPGVLGL